MDDYEAARAEMLAWLRNNNANLDRYEGYVDALESIIYLPSASWEQLRALQPQAMQLQDDIGRLIELARRTGRVVPPGDDELRAEVDAVGNRADALWSRFQEALHEFTRRLGEVGSAHDRRPLAQKSGAHGLYS